MIFKDGWLKRQIAAAKEEITTWSLTKREVMFREEGAKESHTCPFCGKRYHSIFK